MKVKLWGCRGSLPASNNHLLVRKKIRRALEIALDKGLPQDSGDLDSFMDEHLPFHVRGSYGSNTCCVQFDTGHDEYLLADCGSGLRDFGNHVLASKGPGPHVFNILLTHLHWDHLMGFPFFVPAYIPGNVIRFWGCHEDMERAFRTQQSQPFFPVGFDQLGATVEFNSFCPGRELELAGAVVKSLEQDHPGRSYGYRVEQNGKSAVLSTDCEHRDEASHDEYSYLEFFREADLLIFDAQYTFEVATTAKEDWGHSSNVIGVELAKRSKVGTLCLFHQEPTLEDEAIEQFLDNSRRYAGLYRKEQPLEVVMAFDQMELTL